MKASFDFNMLNQIKSLVQEFLGCRYLQLFKAFRTFTKTEHRYYLHIDSQKDLTLRYLNPV
jgi:hypothetical protein